MKKSLSMKKTAAVSALFFSLCCILSANPASRGEFNGSWVGEVIHDDDGYTMDVKIEITGNKVVQYFKGDGGSWRPVEPDDEFFIYDRNNFVYVWVNKGGVWSETQTYSLSFLNDRTMDVVWLRHVNNAKEDSNNDSWNLTGKGRLRKQ